MYLNDFIDTKLTEEVARLWNAFLKEEAGNRGSAMSALALQRCRAQLCSCLYEYILLGIHWNSVSNQGPCCFFRGARWQYKKERSLMCHLKNKNPAKGTIRKKKTGHLYKEGGVTVVCAHQPPSLTNLLNMFGIQCLMCLKKDSLMWYSCFHVWLVILLGKENRDISTILGWFGKGKKRRKINSILIAAMLFGILPWLTTTTGIAGCLLPVHVYMIRRGNHQRASGY